MKLFYRKLGKGDSLIILHGLYGCSDNWLSIARILANNYQVYIPDLRNHGNSPHDMKHDYHVLVEDLLEFCNEHNIQKTILIGHSMGGKLAMSFALLFPYMIEKLVIIDISPRSYLNVESFREHKKQHDEIIHALLNVDFKKIKNRTDVDELLSESIKSKRIRQFLLKNLKRNKDSSYQWKFNLKAIHENLEKTMDSIVLLSENKTCLSPALFIKGTNSNYILDSEEEDIKNTFPSSAIVRIKDAGHWVHAEKTDIFLAEIETFLAD